MLAKVVVTLKGFSKADHLLLVCICFIYVTKLNFSGDVSIAIPLKCSMKICLPLLEILGML